MRTLAASLVWLSFGFGAAAPTALSAAATSAATALSGNMHSMAQSRYDRGAVPASANLHSLELILRRSPAAEAALAAFLLAQQDPRGAGYHAWLSPAQFGTRFGVDANAIATLAAWLRAQGFQVQSPSPGRTRLAFSGTVGQVESAFHTAIHYFEVNGARHFANVTAPQVPYQLVPLIRGIRGLHDFAPHPGARVRPVQSLPQWHSNTGTDYVGPTDFATIYDLTPLYDRGLSGAGVKIAIVAQSDFNPAIPQAYWQALGVDAGQQISVVHVPNGADPGRTGDGNEDEVYLDLEIAGGLAPGAHLLVISDSDAVAAAEYAVDQNLAAILNVSFGSCEAADGTVNATINDLWQQAVAEGTTVVVSAGDEGDADCDSGRSFTQGAAAIDGLAVNGLASPPSALAVGGTDFDPTNAGTWATTNAAATLATAQSYMAEMVWNDTCTNAIFAEENGYDSALGFCNATSLRGRANPYLQIAAGSGGLSTCSAQSASGACVRGYAAPVWQSGVAGNGGWTARALPDVAMLATSWLLCSFESSSDPCSPSTGQVLVSGGTSAAAPAVAAILALLDQSKISAGNDDGRQGLVTPMLYSLAALEFGTASTPNTAGLAACNASKGAAVGANCVFHDITVGTNAMPCNVARYTGAAAGSLPAGGCVGANGDAFGIIGSGGAVAYLAGPGYDLTSGLGSIDAANLVASIRTPTPPTGLSATSNATTVTLRWSAAAGASSYDIYLGTASGEQSATAVRTAVTGTSATLSALADGTTYYLRVTSVCAYGSSVASNEAVTTTVPAAPTDVNASAAGGTITLSWTASKGATGYSVVQMGTTGAGSATPIKTGLTTTSYALGNLVAGTDYSFSVLANNAAGTSAESPSANVTIPPAAPPKLSAAGANGSVNLSWTASGGASSYTLYSGASAGAESTAPRQSGITTTTTTVSGLTNGQAYYFRVVAANAGGSSSASNEANATPTAPGKGGGGLGPAELGTLCLLLACRLRKVVSGR